MSKAQGYPGTSRPPRGKPAQSALTPVGTFTKTQRLRKRPEFQRVQSLGRVVKTRHLVILLQARHPSEGVARLGITASRKVGNAVIRNRAKRVLRSAFRATREIWAQGIDVVIIVRRFESEVNALKLSLELASARDFIEKRTAQAKEDLVLRGATG